MWQLVIAFLCHFRFIFRFRCCVDFIQNFLFSLLSFVFAFWSIQGGRCRHWCRRWCRELQKRKQNQPIHGECQVIYRLQFNRRIKEMKSVKGIATTTQNAQNTKWTEPNHRLWRSQLFFKKKALPNKKGKSMCALISEQWENNQLKTQWKLTKWNWRQRRQRRTTKQPEYKRNLTNRRVDEESENIFLNCFQLFAVASPYRYLNLRFLFFPRSFCQLVAAAWNH